MPQSRNFGIIVFASLSSEYTRPQLNMARSDVERLSALLVKQAEDSAEREGRLAAMVERLVMASPTRAAAQPESAVTAAGAGGPARPRLPLSSTPSPHLHASANLREFSAWREKLSAYFMLTGVSTLPLKEQRAALLGLLDDEWQRTLRYGLNVSDDTPLDDVLQSMEAHLRAQRNVVVDRRDFYARCQQTGVSETSIISRTGHKSAESLKPYIGRSSHAQLRREADVLGSAVAGPSGSGTLVETADGRPAADEETAAAEALAQRAIAGSFTNCTITVNVTYNALRQ
ncbi:hypothetical protein FJT64_004332 [Amphibalanus amphitrite]|uniref:Uncharacterized protein n=1 Tax=Amphibalanus amphitrite TaxID=1232801 RepID=A0A6A4VZH8_AMPAM|nr:hypothetical protein FJT64_004332 [Amphibalanus amphitrite]